ncbi:MAG: TonB-dependent receptor [Bacteroidales bacterium]|nr:TonB-dependent receptor [Bacteroidales bacterium]MBN2817608.1 TonB-dependent receptor [Bacteroidales bacterium]
MNRVLFTFMFLGCAVLKTHSNDIYTQTIRGTVVDAITGYPLIGANVILLNASSPKGATTDLNGVFALYDIPIGRQSLEIRYIGYKSQLINNVLLTSSKELVINIQLEEDPMQVEEVVVKAEKPKEEALNEMAQVSARTFSIEETERFAGSLGDPARMVANYAGVMTQNDSRNDIIIRGNSPMGVLWRLEGVEIPNPNHFGALGTTGGPVSMVNNNLLANSDFLTGAFPAEFGNATSGAFDLNLRSGNNQTREFTGQVGFNGFEFGTEGPLYQAKSGVNPSYIASYRYSTLDLLHKMGFGSGTGEAIPEYQDFTFLVDVPGIKMGRLKVFGLWGKSFISLGREFSDTTENSYNSLNTATDFGSNLAVIGAKHTYFFTDKLRLQTSLSYQSTGAITELDSVNRTEESYKPWIRFNQDEDKLSVSTQLRHKINKRNNYSIGAVADFYVLDYLDSLYMTDYNKFITVTDIKGACNIFRSYAQWQHKFDNNITTYSGLHMQYFDLNNETAVEPRFSVKWQINRKHALSGGFGMHSQLQPKSVYFYQLYDEINDNYQVTNKDVKFTRSNHYVLSYDFFIQKNTRIKAETYYQQLYNIPVFESQPEYSMVNAGGDFGIPREENMENEGTGKNYGIELTVEKFLSQGFYVLFTSSIFDSKYKGYDEIERNTAFNGNYVFNLLGGYEHKLSEKVMLTFDVKTVLAGGKRYVPIDFTESELQGEEIRDWSHAYENKYDDYFRTDLRIGLKLNGNKIWQEWGLDLQNISNYKSIFTEGYNVEKNEVYPVYQQGFMPMMLYRIHF